MATPSLWYICTVSPPKKLQSKNVTKTQQIQCKSGVGLWKKLGQWIAVNIVSIFKSYLTNISLFIFDEFHFFKWEPQAVSTMVLRRRSQLQNATKRNNTTNIKHKTEVLWQHWVLFLLFIYLFCYILSFVVLWHTITNILSETSMMTTVHWSIYLCCLIVQSLSSALPLRKKQTNIENMYIF